MAFYLNIPGYHIIDRRLRCVRSIFSAWSPFDIFFALAGPDILLTYMSGRERVLIEGQHV